VAVAAAAAAAVVVVTASASGAPATEAQPLSFVAIDGGDDSYCAVTTAGGVVCWGWNGWGNLGDGTRVDRRRPVHVIGLSSGVKAVSVARGHSCALMRAGTVECWGSNSWGELGNGTWRKSAKPVQVVGLHDAVAVSAGGEHTCAITSAGGVKCWGSNAHGALGAGISKAFVSTPAAVAATRSAAPSTTANQPALRTVKVDAGEFFFRLSTTSMRPGKIRFLVTNVGHIPHGFWIAGKSTPTIEPGTTATLVVRLHPGAYLYTCTVPGHAAVGMKGRFVVH
jgi:plastocyanin